MTLAQQPVQASSTNGNHEINNFNYGYSSFVNPQNQAFVANGQNFPTNVAMPMNLAEGNPQKPKNDQQADQKETKTPKLEKAELKNSCVSLPLPESPTLSVLEARRRQAQADKKTEEKTDQQAKMISKDGSIKKEDEKNAVKEEEEETKNLTPSPGSSTSHQTDPDFQP